MRRQRPPRVRAAELRADSRTAHLLDSLRAVDELEAVLVRDAVGRLLGTEIQGQDQKLAALIYKLSRDGAFLDMPLEACLARIRVGLGLVAAILVESPVVAPQNSK